MFKIESYITPIILNHLAKYVKNIRPQDAQVSLWEGEVAFQNLDLRLDVLEEELNLPFEFLSGHIHELSILVPWTKITSEPIKITINTIEFVLKLKNVETEASSTSTSPNRRKNPVKKPNKEDDSQQPGGYMPGLATKIINNIVINCHNIILKYVQEDIVVSMNVQLLSWSSANDQWKPDFIDVNPVKFFIRKLVQISDLTICLDKRNSAGQIDVCQEPILYRCTLELRLLRKYNVNSMNIASTLRIAIFTKLLELNISSMQFPMAMRLLKLSMALKSGEIKTNPSSEAIDDEPENPDRESVAGESYLSWAWNLLPSFSFDEPDEEEEVLEIKGHTTDIGIYIETLNFTLKNSEFISDSIVGATKKIRYSPIVRLYLSGIYIETVVSGDQNWFNVKAGLSNIFIEPLGIFKEEDEKVQPFIARTVNDTSNNAFLDKSLFDPNCLIADKGWVVTNCEEYSNRITENYLLYRSPMIALDLVQFNVSDNKLATSVSNIALTESSNRYRDKFRILVSDITFRYNQTFSNIKAVVDELIRSYDYPAYIDDLPESSGSPKLHPPLLEDYDSLMTNIPVRVYKFDLKKITFEIHPKLESNTVTSGKCLKRLPSFIRQSIPYLIINFDHIQGKWITPRDPDKLVHTTCQLPNKPQELLDACYNNSQISLKDLHLSVVRSAETFKIISVSKAQINYGDILHKQLWKDEAIAMRKSNVFLDLIIEFTKQELVTALRIFTCVTSFRHDLLLKLQKNETNLPDKHPKKLRNQFHDVKFAYRKFQQNTMYSISLKHLLSQIFVRRATTKRPLFGTINDENRNWLECKLQIPNNSGTILQTSSNKPVLALWIEEYNFYIDGTLLSFLDYQEDFDDYFEKESSSEFELPVTSVPTTRPALVRRTSRKSAERITRKISQPEETIHFSSERDEKFDTNTTSRQSESSKSSTELLLPIIRVLVVNVEVQHGKIHLSECFEKEVEREEEEGEDSHSNLSLIKLPKIVAKSALADSIKRVSLNTKILHTSKETFPWKVTISDFSIHNRFNNQTNMIVKPVQTAITIALNQKRETLKPNIEIRTSDKIKLIEEVDIPKPSKVSTERRVIVTEKLITSTDELRRISERDSTVSDARDSIQRPSDVGTGSGNGNDTYTIEKPPVPENAKMNLKLKVPLDVIAINLHIDTSPVHVEISASKTKMTKEHINLLVSAFSSMQVTSCKSCLQRYENDAIKIITATEENATIKEFLETETNSESSRIIEDKPPEDSLISLFCQWTIMKFIVELEGSNRNSKTIKFIIDSEDLIATVDKRDDYTKITYKIGTFHGRFLEEKTPGNLLAEESFRIKMLAETAHSPFFNIIITKVRLKDFFQKIGAKLRGDLNRRISEIIISMEALEIIFNLDKVDEFIFAMSPLMEKAANDRSIPLSNAQSKECEKIPFSANSLPMIHLDSKGFTFYVPLKCSKNTCTVSIFKIDEIKITPNVENPLQRNLLRADVFHKAAQLGFLGTPGSIVEDRQYEIKFKNISAATSDWNEILMHMKERADNFYNTNPAFEWNNQGRKASVELREIFDNFMLVITYAPCIVYHNILISGEAIEFNCTNDFIATLTTDQLGLLGYSVKKIQNILRSHQHHFNTSEEQHHGVDDLSAYKLDMNETPMSSTEVSVTQSLPTFEPYMNQMSIKMLPETKSEIVQNKSAELNEELSEKNYSDSGFHSVEKHKNMKKIDELNKMTLKTIFSNFSEQQQVERKLPNTVSIVAGVFMFKFYGFSRKKGFRNKSAHTDFVIPLFSISICQPSYLFTQNIYETKTQISLFNIIMNVSHTTTSSLLSSSSLSLSSNSDSDDEIHFTKSPKTTAQLQFPETILDTQRGELSPSGIPPPLFTFKLHRIKTNKVEIDFAITKPVTVHASVKRIEKITRNIITLLNAVCKTKLRGNKCLKKEYATKIQTLRNTFLNADRFDFKLDQFAIKFHHDNEYKIIFFLDDVKLAMKFILRPEKLNIKASIGSIYLQTEGRMLLHPSSVKISTDLVQETWNIIPIITTNIKFNVIHLDVGVRNIINIKKALRDLYKLKTYIIKRINDFYHDNDREKVACEMMEEPKIGTSSKEEYYQDDLRAGAFQFVEMTSDSFLPLPYQIQIIKKHFGIICWRYPQPRKMSSVHIYPVPMAVPNPIHIKCRMEYFSEAHESFLHFTDFWLSETVSKMIKLPEREVTAHIWRVVILQSLVSINGECFDTSEEDEEFNSITSIKIEDILNEAEKEGDFLLNPKVLVGCMRIDTAFIPMSIPKSQLFLSVNRIQLSLQNQESKTAELPTVLRKFKTSMETNVDHNFLSIIMERGNFYGSSRTFENYSLDFDFILSVKCLDYGFLNMIQVLEESDFNGYICVKDSYLINTSLVVDRIRLSIGPAILHTLLSSKVHWEEALAGDIKEHLILKKFTFVNRTHLNISFGQTGTNERIQLQSKRCHLYSFRNDNLEQEITFFIVDEKTQAIESSPSVPITLEIGNIGDTKIKNICFEDKCLIISMKKLSSCQVLLLIKGQIELISEVSDEFRLDFRNGDMDDENISEAVTCEYFTKPYDRISLLHSVNADMNLLMRMRFKGPTGKGRTGDIPLRINKHLPWLVKVPINANNYNYISFWVRILREDISKVGTDSFKPQKILISIWPIFEIRSMLTHSVLAEESTTSESFEVRGMFGRTELRVPATHETDHKIYFSKEFLATMPAEKHTFNLSLRSIDWNKFFWYDEKVWKVDKVLLELPKRVRRKWPCTNEEEIRLNRRVTEPSSNIDILYRCHPSYMFSCSLTLELAPWALFINGTDQRISVTDNESKFETIIDSNYIAMIPRIATSFSIVIGNGTDALSSLPIYFNACNTDLEAAERLAIGENSSIEITMQTSENFFKFILQFQTDNGINFFFLKSKFVFTNFTSHNITVLPYAIDDVSKLTFSAVESVILSNKKLISRPTGSVDNCIGISVDNFACFNIKNSTLKFFISLKTTDDSDISFPISLGSQFNRYCFPIIEGHDAIPLTASLIENNGQYFLNILEDVSPPIRISNHTDLPLMITKSSLLSGCKFASFEYDDIEWIQKLYPSGNSYYTPQDFYENFPDNASSECSFAIALYKANLDKYSIKWSKPIRTDISSEKFLHIPGHGDVKVVVCGKHKTIRISIFYVSQQLEFSVKDIRSRLHDPKAIKERTSIENDKQEIENQSSNHSNKDLLEHFKSEKPSNCSHFDESPQQQTQLRMRFFVKEFKMKLFNESKACDYLKTEIFSLHVDDFMLAFNEFEQNLHIIMGNLQIDNQLFSSGNYDFPVLLCSQRLYQQTFILPSVYYLEKTYEELRHNSMVMITLSFYDEGLKLRAVTVKLSPIRIYIEDTYLNDLMDALIECNPSSVALLHKHEIGRHSLSAGNVLLPKDVVVQALIMSEPMHLQYFRVEPIDVMLSVHTCVRLYIALDHSPLHFSTYERLNIVTLPYRFGHILGMHYLSGALFGAGWVVGSLEILGSPSGLARSFTVGFRDFLSMPVQGLFRGPWGFVVGITQGSASLLRNVTAGTVNSVTKLASSVARNLDRLSLDQEHIQRTEALRRSRPQGFAEGFSQGITGLGISILGAVGGLARHTLEARSPVEVVTGVGKGIVGAFTKPISGAAELVALTGQGVLHTVGFNAMPQQRAPSTTRNIAIEPAENCLWKTIPNLFADDQVFFYHEVTLVISGQMKNAHLFLTSAIFGVMDFKRDKLVFVIPVDKIEATCDSNDPTLINVCAKETVDEFGAEDTFTNQRIISFLHSATSQTALPELKSYIEDNFVGDSQLVPPPDDNLRWSFYINEHVGRHLLQYIRLICRKKFLE